VKKSVSIHLTLMASMALVSCGRSRRCVDPAGQVVPDAMCAGPVVRPGYHWLYVAGRSVTRFSTGSPHGASAPADGVSRGGFGAHGEAHASGSSAAHAAG
jgi:hypothetical protein